MGSSGLDAASRQLGVALRHQWLERFASGLAVEMANLEFVVGAAL
jgi:hypothetical protein